MHDPITDLLSLYRDGDLPEQERARVAAHLPQCETCRGVLAELEQVVLHAGALQPLQPRHDLWSGIAARIAEEAASATDAELPHTASAGAADRAAAATSRAERRSRWTLTLSVPQLAAAALALVMISVGAARLFDARSPAGTAPAFSGPNGSGAVQLVSDIDRSYEMTVAQLEQALDEARDVLDPATVSVLEQSLAAIDAAIADARAALAADPANAFLTRHLEQNMRRKVDLLREASRAAART